MEAIDVGADEIRQWCLEWLGSAPEAELFSTGHLARVLGLRLADGREVVLKIRPAEERQAGCALVHRHLWQAGLPCPEPLAGPSPLDGFAVNAEARLSGGAPYLAGPGPERATAFASLLARFIQLAPHADQVPNLRPSPAWMHWYHGFEGVWPPPDDRDDDLNAHLESAWLDDFGRRARARLVETRDVKPAIGHCDWESHNLDFRDGAPWAVHDWDSVVCEAETVIVGTAAAMWPAGVGCAGASLDESADFLTAYQQARGREFTEAEIRQTWAAGLWIRSFNAKKYLLDGFETLTEAEAVERAHLAAA